MSPSDGALDRAKEFVQQIRSSRGASRLPAGVREQVLRTYRQIQPPADAIPIAGDKAIV
jgi:hypothetical protein